MENNKKEYEIIWIDDEWQRYEEAIKKAREYNVMVTPFKSVDDAWRLLQHTIDRWDGVILDTSCFIECDDTTADIDALFEAINRLNELKSQREIPYYVYTSEQRFINNPVLSKALVDTKVYIKGNYESERNLILDIKHRADSQLRTTVKMKYARIIDNVSPDIRSLLVPVLMNYERNNFRMVSDMNRIRIIMEKVMVQLEEIGLLSESDYADSRNNDPAHLTDKCHALLHKDISRDICPPYIRSHLIALARACNDGSHNSPLTALINRGKRQYIHGASTLQLLTILEWEGELDSKM